MRFNAENRKICDIACTAFKSRPWFQRRTATGHTLPSWLLNKGPALLKKHVRASKYDPLCEEVDLIHVTPSYAQVRLKSGREQTVSLRDLAPLPQPATEPAASSDIASSPRRPVSDRSPDFVSSPPTSEVAVPTTTPGLSDNPPIQVSEDVTLLQEPALTMRRSTRNVDRVDYSGMC